MRRNVYTEVIKDAIGNDPVLDQYEFDYTSTYAGSSQDDHITGTLISKNAEVLTTDTRGRNFSTYSTQDANYLGYSAAEITKFPRTSARLQSNREISSTQQLRHSTSIFDDKERWYDSCLPDLFAALQHDGTHIKTLTTSMKVDVDKLHSGSLIDATDFSTIVATIGANPTIELKDYSGKNMESLLSLSPMATFTTKSLGFVTFNVPRLNEADDPSINNEWTWSYPFENKFNPTNRFLKVNDFLNLNVATSRVLPAFSGSLNGNFLPPHDNRPPYASAPVNLPNISYASQNINIKFPSILEGIVPVIPGRLPQNILSSNSAVRNGSRTFNPYDSDSYFYPIGEVHDEKLGFSYLKMGDTFLNQKTNLGKMIPDSNDFFNHPTNPFPDLGVPDIATTLGGLSNMNPYITGSAQKSDLIKFFFGFGDVSNVCYGRYELDETKSVRIYDYSSLAGNSGSADDVFNKPYITRKVDGDIGEYWVEVRNVNPMASINWYTFQSAGVVSGYHSEYGGDVKWLSSSSPSNNQILASANEDYPGPPGIKQTDTFDSKMFLDVYCESPWRYSYVRGISSLYTASYVGSAAFRMHVHGQTDLLTSSAGKIYNTYMPYGIRDAVDHLPVNMTSITGSNYYGQRDMLTGSAEIIVIDPSASSYESNIYPPGYWRIGFFFHHHGGPSGGNNRAFITNISVDAFPASAFTADETSRMGGNNYPEFRDINLDARNCPKDDDYQFYYYMSGSGSPVGVPGYFGTNKNNLNTDRHRHFQSSPVGISPIIRGWKYGLASGFPTYSRATWRRNRFGQLRDMLEQRPYSKFIYDHMSTPLANVATPGAAPNTIDGRTPQLGQLEPGPVEVNYIKRRYKRDERGIGYIYNEKVDGSLTLSQNTSTEVTSSVPYVDGIAVLRQESELSSIKI